jgi:lipoyl(octanoyl) transferase
MLPAKMKFDFLSPFGVQETEIHFLSNEFILIEKPHWDFKLAWMAQKSILQRMDQCHEKYIIFTSHPNVLTMGKGLQKPKKGEELNLTENSIEDMMNLPFPLHQIERGGGLTFHHPGQFIVYPLIRLHPDKLGLSELVDDLLGFSKMILEDNGMNDLIVKRSPLGLWQAHKKLASVGIAVDHMKTFHGMALNLKSFNDLKNTLKDLSPCGLNFNTYTSVEEEFKTMSWKHFANDFKQKIEHAW